MLEKEKNNIIAFGSLLSGFAFLFGALYCYLIECYACAIICMGIGIYLYLFSFQFFPEVEARANKKVKIGINKFFQFFYLR